MNYIALLFFSLIFISNCFSAHKNALIIGINGQDGCFLTKFLYNKGYSVHGIVRSPKSDLTNLKKTLKNAEIDFSSIHMWTADLMESEKIKSIIHEVMPDEIYNLAAQSNIDLSFKEPFLTTQVNILGSLAVFDAVKELQNQKIIKICHASTVEVFGLNQNNCDENTPYTSASPYGETKIFTQKMAEFYRKQYGTFISCAILSNHESSLRPDNFTTKKITKGVAEYSLGKRENITVGNIDLIRDWGHAEDFVEALWLMLQQMKADNYVVSTGEPHSIKEFIEEAFKQINVTIYWQGNGLQQIGYNELTKKMLVQVDAANLRPIDVPIRLGNPQKINTLGWKHKRSFKEIVQQMVADDLKALQQTQL